MNYLTFPGVIRRDPENIIADTARKLGVDMCDIYSKTRKREVVEARQISMWRIKMLYPNFSWREIGDFFSKDHATALHSIRIVNDLMETDKQFNQKVQNIIH